ETASGPRGHDPSAPVRSSLRGWLGAADATGVTTHGATPPAGARAASAAPGKFEAKRGYAHEMTEDVCMRTLKLHFPAEALPTLDTYLKQTKEARVFRRAQAVRE